MTILTSFFSLTKKSGSDTETFFLGSTPPYQLSTRLINHPQERLIRRLFHFFLVGHGTYLPLLLLLLSD